MGILEIILYVTIATLAVAGSGLLFFRTVLRVADQDNEEPHGK